jgi:hypothetical protein
MRCEACGADSAADDAEIERLIKTCDVLEQESVGLKALLAECADALETSGPIISQSPLVRQAREASKNEQA